MFNHQASASNPFQPVARRAALPTHGGLSSSRASKFITNCPTPDSVLSTGSASIYSSLFAKSSSFMLPEKLQIVKPIEGSQTLQHWQHLATPNLGCLFEERPGIRLKGHHDHHNPSNSNLLLAAGDKKDGLSFNTNETDEGKIYLILSCL